MKQITLSDLGQLYAILKSTLQNHHAAAPLEKDIPNPAAFARERLGWTPDPKQAAILESTAQHVILNCCRQWGKTTVAATKILHLVLTRPGAVAIIVSENLSQTAEFFAKIDYFLARLGLSAKGESGKAIARRLLNGSRIVGLAARESAVRGYTADFIFIDEAARIPDEVIDAFDPVGAVRRAHCWLASTPKGRRGRFFEIWNYATHSDWFKISATVDENPRIDPAYVARVRREKGEDYYLQEFGCQFIESGIQLLSLDQVDNLALKQPERN